MRHNSHAKSLKSGDHGSAQLTPISKSSLGQVFTPNDTTYIANKSVTNKAN